MMVFDLWGDVVEMWSYRDAQPRTVDVNPPHQYYYPVHGSILKCFYKAVGSMDCCIPVFLYPAVILI